MRAIFTVMIFQDVEGGDYKPSGAFDTFREAYDALAMLEPKLKDGTYYIDGGIQDNKRICIDFTSTVSYIQVEYTAGKHPLLVEIEQTVKNIRD